MTEYEAWQRIFTIVGTKELWAAAHPKGTRFFKEIADRELHTVIQAYTRSMTYPML